MSYQYVEYQYPIAQLFHKELLWTDKNCNVYFAFKLLASDDWTYYAGNSSHALTAAGLLTSYGSSEQDAITNYLTTTRDYVSGKVVAMLPANFLAKYARVYIEEGVYVTVYEWTPSVYITANEIVTGELLITDMLSDSPTIRIVANSVDRIKLGKVGEHYGLFGYDDAGNLVFEMSDEGQTIGGWTFTEDTLSCGSGDNGLILDAANSKIESTNYSSGAMGKGFHLSPELIEVNNASIRGVLQCIVFKKDTINAVGGDLLIVDSDVLDADMTALDSCLLTIKGESAFAVNDILRIKADAFNDEWLRVTDISAAPTYTVTRDLVGSYAANNNPAWPKGSAVVNYRQSGNGLLYLTAADITGSPSMSVVTYGATPWSDATTQLKIGNLEGFLGMGNVYGFAVGNSEQYIKYDPAGGLRIKGDIIIDGAATSVAWEDITGIPSTLGTPSGSGLFLSASHMGYYADSTWKTYIDSNGNMVLGNVSTGAGLSWNQTTGVLTIKGAIELTNTLDYGSITGGPPADADVTLSKVNGGLLVTGGGITLSGGGSFKGGQTAYNVGTGFFLGYESGYYKLSIGNPSGNYITWDGVSALNISGNLTMLSGSVLSVLLPSVGQYSYNTAPGTITGAICITLPQWWTSTMMSFDVQVFEYLADKSFTMHLSGYNYTANPPPGTPTSGQWARTTYSILGGQAGTNPQVRFGHNGTKCCIVIGTTSSVWHFPKVTVRNFQAGYLNYTEAQWATGWALSVITSETGYTFSATHTAPINDADVTLSVIEDSNSGAGLYITGGGITLSSGGSFKGGKSSYADNTAGFFLGWDGTDNKYKFNIGDTDNYLKWDGSALNIKGKIDVGTTGFISAGKTSYADNTEGFFLGYEGGYYKLNIGNQYNYLKWTGGSISLSGADLSAVEGYYTTDSYWKTNFDILDIWTQVVTGTGSITRVDGYLRLRAAHTGGTASITKKQRLMNRGLIWPYTLRFKVALEIYNEGNIYNTLYIKILTGDLSRTYAGFKYVPGGAGSYGTIYGISKGTIGSEKIHCSYSPTTLSLTLEMRAFGIQMPPMGGYDYDFYVNNTWIGHGFSDINDEFVMDPESIFSAYVYSNDTNADIELRLFEAKLLTAG